MYTHNDLVYINPMTTLTADEKEALKITLLFRVDLLKRIEFERLEAGTVESTDIARTAREQIDNLTSAAVKLELP